MSASDELIQQYQDRTEYDHGFVTDIETIDVPKGLSEETVKFISNQKKEPQWMLDWRLNAFNRLQKMKEPDWQKPKYPKINYQDLYYYSAPKNFKDGKNFKRTGRAGIFAGSLELVKEGNLKIKQKDLFDDIYIRENK